MFYHFISTVRKSNHIHLFPFQSDYNLYFCKIITKSNKLTHYTETNTTPLVRDSPSK